MGAPHGDRGADMVALRLRLTPHGHLLCEPSADAPALDEALATRLGEAFAHGSGDGLLRLGAGEVGQPLPPVFVWWRGFPSRYVAALCSQAAGTGGEQTLPEMPAPTEVELASLVLTAPMMPGAEYLTPEVLRNLWAAIGTSLAAALAASGTGLQDLLRQLNP